jgi:hypothetical protein
MRTILLSVAMLGLTLMLSSAHAENSSDAHLPVITAPAEAPCAGSPGGKGQCREYHLGSGCGVLAGSVGCHTTAQVEVYNDRCRQSSRWGKKCRCK